MPGDFYDSARFVGRESVVAPTLPALSQVFTASDHVVTSTHTSPNLVPFGEAVIIVGGAVQIDTVGTSKDAYVIALQNGTSVLATAAPLNTAGSNGVFAQVLVGTITSGGVLSVSVKGTGTASATQTSPVLRLNLIYKRQFV